MVFNSQRESNCLTTWKAPTWKIFISIHLKKLSFNINTVKSDTNDFQKKIAHSDVSSLVFDNEHWRANQLYFIYRAVLVCMKEYCCWKKMTLLYHLHLLYFYIYRTASVWLCTGALNISIRLSNCSTEPSSGPKTFYQK